jgi:MoaA/NifB/PqqE/SkfB family radical SAM enzyme
MKINKAITKAFKQSTGYTYKHLCYAPFNTLRFNEDGLVTTCCFNTEYILGDYKTQSLQEIIDGDKRKKLQKLIKKRELPVGCEFCAQDLQSGNFTDIATLWYPPKIHRKHYPLNLEFKTSLACNLDCIMCSNGYRVHSDIVKEKTIYGEQFRTELQKLIPILKNVTFNGGEPLIIPLYFDLWQDIIQRNPDCEITVHTSLSVLPDKFRKLLDKGNFHIVASIDSLIPERYENIRKHANFKQVTDNLNYILNHKKNGNRISLNFCPMKCNWQEIPDFIEFCNDRNLVFNFSIVYFPFIHSVFNLHLDEIKAIAAELSEKLERLKHGINNAKLQVYIKKLNAYIQLISDHPELYVSKQELKHYLLTLPNAPDTGYEAKIHKVFEQISDNQYLNLFKIFGKDHKRRTLDIVNEMQESKLIDNIKSLNKSTYA